MIIKSGTYTGTGSAQHIATGNTPNFVICKAYGTVGGVGAAEVWAKTSTMAADAVKSLETNTLGLETGRITSFDSTGFNLGTSTTINRNTTTYWWLSIEQESGDLDFEVGSYSGNGTDNRDITLSTITGTPSLVIVMGEYTQGAFFRTNVHTGDASGWFGNVASHTTNGIQSFGAGKFQVGTRDHVNRGTGTPTYHYVVMREVTGLFEVLLHTGTGGDDYSFSGAGFTPTFAFMRLISGNQQTVWKHSAHSGDTTGLTSITDDVSDHIQAFESDGIQLGTNNRVNQSTQSYAVMLLKDSSVSVQSNSLMLLGVG